MQKHFLAQNFNFQTSINNAHYFGVIFAVKAY